MGSAYTTIAADALARYHRLKQKQVTLVTGTDEHGEKIADSARAKGIDPQQHCDEIVESFKSLWEQVSTGKMHRHLHSRRRIFQADAWQSLLAASFCFWHGTP